MTKPIYYDTSNRQTAIQIGCSVIAVGCAITALLTPREYRIVPLGFGFGAAMLATQAAETKRLVTQATLEQRQVASVQAQAQAFTDYRPGTYLTELKAHLERVSTQQAINQAVNTTLALPQFTGVELTDIDWADYPHLMIMGETGSGKTTLAEWLAAKVSRGNTYGITPHQSPEDFPTCRAVWGAGRNFTNGKTEPVLSWEECLRTPTASVSQVLAALYLEMDRRAQARASGDTSYEQDPIDLYIDEVPACAANVPNWKQVIPALVMEARKFKIRLIFLTQGTLVEMLGLEGRSQIRDTISLIRLKKFAKLHAASLLTGRTENDTDMVWTEEAYKAFCQLSYQAMIDNFICKVPALETMKADIQAATRTREPVLPTIPKAEGINSPQFLADEDMLNQAINLLEAGTPKESIIKDFWGFHGAEYEIGLQRWKQLRLPG